ncbi:MAG: transketolase [Firmicutes bacterium]|nr:transketolase [Bacillota bacterium]
MEAHKLSISTSQLQKLNTIAWELRIKSLEMIIKANSGHPGPSFSVAEIITSLYFHTLKVDPDSPKCPERDRFILSKGHACPILYATLARLGFFPEEWLWTLRRPGSKLQGHPDMKGLPGIDMTTGSLGNGLSAGVGMAFGGKYDKKNYDVFVVLGDGELQEGTNWEAMMSAAQYELDNLIAIVDSNKIQSGGPVKNIMNLEPLADKWDSFGWHVEVVDGHDIQVLVDSYEQAKRVQKKPSVIIANTTKGKGVSFMENQFLWHARVPTSEEAEQAFRELKKGVNNH